MMTPKRRQPRGAILLATTGVLVMLTGMALHWWRPTQYPLEWAVQLIGAAMAFAGFYDMNPNRAKDGGGFLVDAGLRIIDAVRLGRRATDPVVAVSPRADPTPLDEEAIPPTGGFPPSTGGQ